MKTSKYKVKIVCGFRKDQEFTIDANEAHKAYYLFNNPEKRGTFDNGLAIKGSDIQRIEPDYHATMGWNTTYQLTSDDWNEIHSSGAIGKLRDILYLAKEVGRHGEEKDLRLPLVTLKEKYKALAPASTYAKQLVE